MSEPQFTDGVVMTGCRVLGLQYSLTLTNFLTEWVCRSTNVCRVTIWREMEFMNMTRSTWVLSHISKSEPMCPLSPIFNIDMPITLLSSYDFSEVSQAVV